jgi:hypothetical protein
MFFSNSNRIGRSQNFILFFRFNFSIFQLRKAVVDHVSDTFVATNVPLIALIDGARRGQIQLVEETAPVFMEHAMKLIEVGCKKKHTPISYFNHSLRLRILFVQCRIQLKESN